MSKREDTEDTEVLDESEADIRWPGPADDPEEEPAEPWAKIKKQDHEVG
jgi:hypothetical protein